MRFSIKAGPESFHFHALALPLVWLHSQRRCCLWLWLCMACVLTGLSDSLISLLLHPANCQIYFLFVFGCADTAWFDHPSLTVIIASMNFDIERVHRWICSCPLVMLMVTIVVPQPIYRHDTYFNWPKAANDSGVIFLRGWVLEFSIAAKMELRLQW